jgi:segregation and condensation protein A
VDLKNLSILRLAEQYLEFIQEARRLRLEIAADYLVMAAWLAYLKSRLLLPEPPGEAELSGEEMAARLQFQLERLAAMRQAADRLMARERLGYDVFPRGMPEGVTVLRTSLWDCTLYDLLRAYAEQVGRPNVTQLRVAPPAAFSVEEAIRWLSALLGRMPDWASLEAFLPGDLRTGFERRSAAASTFAASLELAKQGRLQIRQAQPFGPILVRGVEGG